MKTLIIAIAVAVIGATSANADSFPSSYDYLYKMCGSTLPNSPNDPCYHKALELWRKDSLAAKQAAQVAQAKEWRELNNLGECFTRHSDNILDQFACASERLRDKCGPPKILNNIGQLQDPENSCVITSIQEYTRAKREAAQQKAQKIEAENQAARKQQQDRYNVAVRAGTERDEANGYKLTTVRDFKLDGQQLAAANAKISVQGYYAKRGQLEAVLSNQVESLMYAAGTASDDVGISIISKDASRTLRAYMMDCTTPYQGRSCPVVLLGQVSICTRTTIVGTYTTPCLIVEDGRPL